MLLAGIFAIASPQFVSSSLNPLITSILLAAAFALLLYALLEGFIVEGPMANPADTKLKLIAPPATSAPSLPETSARTVEPSLADATPAHVALKG